MSMAGRGNSESIPFILTVNHWRDSCIQTRDRIFSVSKMSSLLSMLFVFPRFWIRISDSLSVRILISFSFSLIAMRAVGVVSASKDMGWMHPCFKRFHWGRLFRVRLISSSAAQAADIFRCSMKVSSSAVLRDLVILKKTYCYTSSFNAGNILHLRMYLKHSRCMLEWYSTKFEQIVGCTVPCWLLNLQCACIIHKLLNNLSEVSKMMIPLFLFLHNRKRVLWFWWSLTPSFFPDRSVAIPLCEGHCINSRQNWITPQLWVRKESKLGRIKGKKGNAKLRMSKTILKVRKNKPHDAMKSRIRLTKHPHARVQPELWFPRLRKPS